MNQTWTMFYYLANLFVTMSYAVGIVVYLGRFDQQNPKTRAFQRLLVWMVAWAFYDVLATWAARGLEPDAAFLVFRLFSFMWMGLTGAAPELVLTLIRPVSWRDRLWLYGVPFLFYLAAIALPDYISPRVYDIPRGYPDFPSPWNLGFRVYWMVVIVLMALALGRSAYKEKDPAARREKAILLVGVVLSASGLYASRLLVGHVTAGFPSLGNLAMVPFMLAAFWSLKRYGRVLSRRMAYKAILQMTPSGIASLVEGRLAWGNLALARQMGLARPEDLSGITVQKILHPVQPAGLDLEQAAANLRSAQPWEGELNLRHSSGVISPCLVRSAPLEPGEPEQGSVAVFADIAERKRAEQEREALITNLEEARRELTRLSYVDGLTGLANRRRFDQVLEQEWRRAARRLEPLGLIMLDLDHFKIYNDTYGHPAGDQCLKQVARVLGQGLLRPGDLAARYGGEEFAALLPGNDEIGVTHVAERLRAAILSMGLEHRGSPVAPFVSVSLGAASLRPTDDNAPQDLVAAADRALYAAKQAGRNRVVSAHGDSDEDAAPLAAEEGS